MLICDFPLYICILLPALAVILIGMSKAGFGGGVGLVTTPLLSMVFPAKVVVGFLLPLLIIADWFTIYHYRGEWDLKNLVRLIPGAVFGIIMGTMFVDVISDVELKRTIGFVAIGFLILQTLRSRAGSQSQYQPKWWHGFLAGMLAGFLSAIAHSAGVIITMFLLPQKLPKRTFVATMALFFAVVNLLKVPGYLIIDLITWQSFKTGLFFIVFIPFGVKLGVWLNNKIPQELFTKIIYVLVFIIAVQLLLGKNIIMYFMGM